MGNNTNRGSSALCTMDDASSFLVIRLGPKTSECEKNVTVVSTATGRDVTNCATTLHAFNEQNQIQPKDPKYMIKCRIFSKKFEGFRLRRPSGTSPIGPRINGFRLGTGRHVCGSSNPTAEVRGLRAGRWTWSSKLTKKWLMNCSFSATSDRWQAC